VNEWPIEEVYFNWLYSKVASTDTPTPSLTFYTLLHALHSNEFVWIVPGDDNRAEDGLDVRREFFVQRRVNDDENWVYLGCSVLEMIIAFSRKAEFETSLSQREWFWIFMTNLEIASFNDGVFSSLPTHDSSKLLEHLQELITIFVWRTYTKKGLGGMMPINSAKKDQTKVEIWYQFCDYVVEKDIY
jgi:hypothetical protein